MLPYTLYARDVPIQDVCQHIGSVLLLYYPFVNMRCVHFTIGRDYAAAAASQRLSDDVKKQVQFDSISVYVKANDLAWDDKDTRKDHVVRIYSFAHPIPMAPDITWRVSVIDSIELDDVVMATHLNYAMAAFGVRYESGQGSASGVAVVDSWHDSHPVFREFLDTKTVRAHEFEHCPRPLDLICRLVYAGRFCKDFTYELPPLRELEGQLHETQVDMSMYQMYLSTVRQQFKKLGTFEFFLCGRYTRASGNDDPGKLWVCCYVPSRQCLKCQPPIHRDGCGCEQCARWSVGRTLDVAREVDGDFDYYTHQTVLPDHHEFPRHPTRPMLVTMLHPYAIFPTNKIQCYVADPVGTTFDGTEYDM